MFSKQRSSEINSFQLQRIQKRFALRRPHWISIGGVAQRQPHGSYSWPLTTLSDFTAFLWFYKVDMNIHLKNEKKSVTWSVVSNWASCLFSGQASVMARIPFIKFRKSLVWRFLLLLKANQVPRSRSNHSFIVNRCIYTLSLNDVKFAVLIRYIYL